jgi:hypothetical protein
MNRVIRVTVEIAEDSPATPSLDEVVAVYTYPDCQWRFEGGAVYPRHLKVLTGITDLVREADRG